MKIKTLAALVYVSIFAQGYESFLVEFNKLSDCQQEKARIFPNNEAHPVYWIAFYPQECK